MANIFFKTLSRFFPSVSSRSDGMSFRTPVLDNYFWFLGFFISEFAELEFAMRHALNKHTETDVGFPRFSELKERLKDAIAGKYVGQEDKIKRVFDHLSQISVLRDRMVHYGFTTNSDIKGLGIRTHRLKPSQKTKEKHDITTQENLMAAGTDLQAIKFFIGCYLSLEHDFKDLESAGIVPFSLLPWRYKPI